MTPPAAQMDPNMCLELALEGERLCKSGDFTAGVSFLEAANRVGTDDKRVQSAIYSQLGNAYFYLTDYEKALGFHELDLNIVKAQRDVLGEAKASGNLGNTLKMLNRFDEAILFCERHLLISKAEKDKIGEGRAYYNLGNVYHTQGKQLAKETQQEPGNYPLEVRVCLHKAVECYERNLDLMVKLSDRVAQGRAYGNLGNTHYLLGNFRRAITFHEQRLKFAIEFRDRAAERRAYSNLGNCHVFLDEFDVAAEYYRKTLHLAQQLNDRAVEAQACYSLGNTYTLIGDINTALDFHKEHLQIAKQLKDKIGESRAYLSISNCHQNLGEFDKALVAAKQNRQLFIQSGDVEGERSAERLVEQLQAKVGKTIGPPQKLRRSSMDKMDLVRMTPDPSEKKSRKSSRKKRAIPEGGEEQSTSSRLSQEDVANNEDKDTFLNMLSSFQANRMEDQRCQITDGKENQQLSAAGCSKRNALRNRSVSVDTHGPSTSAASSENQVGARTRASVSGESVPIGGARSEVRDELLDLIEGMQSRRMDEQRISLPQLPGLASRTNNNNLNSANNNNSQVVPNRMQRSGEDFFDILARCQSSRLDEQRSRMPEHADSVSLASVDSASRLVDSSSESGATASRPAARTVPDEDFLCLILKVQGNRIDDQRTAFQPRSDQENATDSGNSSVASGSRPGSRKRNDEDDNSSGSKASASTRSKSSFKNSLKQALIGREEAKKQQQQQKDKVYQASVGSVSKH